MQQIQPPDGVYLAKSRILRAGRGVFAARAFRVGALIERCPVVVVPDEERRLLLRQSELVNYYFLWGADRKSAAIALGYGSLYNHSYDPNALYHKKIGDRLLEIRARRAIVKDEEITVNYNGDPEDLSPLWIKDIKPPSKKT